MPVPAERERAVRLAEEYRERGYDVSVDPDDGLGLPPGYRPDLVVRRGEETVVVEVASRTSLASEPRIREVAQLVEARPGWRFELILVGEEPVAAPPGAVPSGRGDVERTLEESRALAASGFTGPALLSGWAATEAALRLLLRSEGIEPRSLALAPLLKQAAEEGLLSKPEYHGLARSLAQRNALAHGFQVDGVDPASVSALLSLAERLIEEATPLRTT